MKASRLVGGLLAAVLLIVLVVYLVTGMDEEQPVTDSRPAADLWPPTTTEPFTPAQEAFLDNLEPRLVNVGVTMPADEHGRNQLVTVGIMSCDIGVSTTRGNVLRWIQAEMGLTNDQAHLVLGAAQTAAIWTDFC